MKKMNQEKIEIYCKSHHLYKFNCYNCDKELFKLSKDVFQLEKVETMPCYICGWNNPIDKHIIYVQEQIDKIEI